MVLAQNTSGFFASQWFVGILSGVIASIIYFVVSRVLIDYLVPRYRSLIYQGIDVSGTWIVTQSGLASDGKGFAVKREVIVDLKQSAYTVYGNAESVTKSGSDGIQTDDRVKYNVTGSVKNGFLVIIFECPDKKRVLFSSFLLQFFKDGQVLKGQRTFYGYLSGNIRAVECTWQRESVYQQERVIAEQNDSSTSTVPSEIPDTVD